MVAQAGIHDPAPQPAETTYCSFIDGGSWPTPPGTPPSTRDIVDPSSGAVWACAELADGTPAVGAVVSAAHRAYESDDWQRLSNTERARLLRRLGYLIAGRADEIARLETLANGKPLRATAGEARTAKTWYDYYANAIEMDEGIIRQVSRSMDAHVVREPLGVVLAITPYNGAFSLGSWKLAPALAAGNSVILKPPPTAPGSSIVLAELAIEAGLPAGIVNVLVGDAGAAAEVLDDPRTAMVSFTGSTRVARSLGAEAASRMKRYVCEAGGKSAHIVFEDADLDAAVVGATQGIFSGAGQTCVAGSRILVHATIYDTFVERFKRSTERLVVGDPLSPETHVGPIGLRAQFDRIRDHVANAIAAGATVVTGGGAPGMPTRLAGGFWFQPTILAGLPTDAAICREEVFGPVAIVQPFADEAEAVRLANSVDYGLAAGFWTRDAQRIRRVSARLQAGTVWINCYRAINVHSPFGGYKQSGIGRENGVEALDEFRQTKSIVASYERAADPFDY